MYVVTTLPDVTQTSASVEIFCLLQFGSKKEACGKSGSLEMCHFLRPPGFRFLLNNQEIQIPPPHMSSL